MYKMIDEKEYAKLAIELATIIRNFKGSDSEAIQTGAEFINAAFTRIDNSNS